MFLVRKYFVLHRKIDACAVYQVDDRNMIFHGDLLGTEIFLPVIGNQAPALTVASLATIMHNVPLTRPIPQTTPAAGQPPSASYIPYAANAPISSHSAPLSNNNATRSLAESLPSWCNFSFFLSTSIIDIG